MSDRCAHRYPARPDGSGIGCRECRQLAEARTERDRAMAAAQSRAGAGWDSQVIDQAIAHFASLGEPFSADDCRELLPPVHPNLIGARFLAASKRGQIERVGDQQSRSRTRHASRIGTWVGTQQATRRTA